MEQKRVLDISHWNGVFDWGAVKASGVWGVILKAGGSDAGRYTDVKFEEYYTGAKNAGLHVGAYYFTGPEGKGAEAGRADAEHFKQIIAGKQFDLPVYCDFEAPDTTDKNANTHYVVAFGEAMEAAGYFVGVYASDDSGFSERLDLDRVKRFTIWAARWGHDLVYTKDLWDIWQTGSGAVPGIDGDVDLDICRRDFPETITGKITGKGFNGYAGTEWYTIRPGDTLSAISRAFDTSVAELLALNPKITNADYILAGDTIRIK